MTGFSVCFIGNSHIAAFKQAWDQRRPKLRDGVEATFFSAQNRLMKDIVPEGRSLVAEGDALAEKLRFTSGGLDRIDIDDYHAFVIVGAGFGLDMRRVISDCGVTVPWRWGDDVGPLYSHRCLEAQIQAHLEESSAVRLIDAIHNVSDAPVLLVGAPYVCERAADDENQPWLKDEPFVEAVAGCGRRAAEAVVARHKVDAVWQRPETMARPGFTATAFNDMPSRFQMKSKAPAFDFKHGNLDYGALMLADTLAELDRLTGGKVLAAKKKTKATPPPASKASSASSRR